MQNRAKMINFSILVFIMTLIFTALRTALMIFSFDFDAYLFDNKILASVIFFLFTLALFATTFFKKSFNGSSGVAKENLLTEILLAFIALLFLALGVATTMDWSARREMFYQPMTAVESVTYIIAIPCAFISFIYYLARLFAKDKSKKSLALLALFPVLSLASLLTQNFAKVSATASSLALFPNILCLAVLAFFILTEGREYLLNKNGVGKYFTSLFIAFSSLFFSAIPDLIFITGGKTPLTFNSFVFLSIKLVFIIYTLHKVILLILAAEKR